MMLPLLLRVQLASGTSCRESAGRGSSEYRGRGGGEMSGRPQGQQVPTQQRH